MCNEFTPCYNPTCSTFGLLDAAAEDLLSYYPSRWPDLPGEILREKLRNGALTVEKGKLLIAKRTGVMDLIGPA